MLKQELNHVSMLVLVCIVQRRVVEVAWFVDIKSTVEKVLRGTDVPVHGCEMKAIVACARFIRQGVNRREQVFGFEVQFMREDSLEIPLKVFHYTAQPLPLSVLEQSSLLQCIALRSWYQP